jgi:hypothetical protein
MVNLEVTARINLLSLVDLLVGEVDSQQVFLGVASSKDE